MGEGTALLLIELSNQKWHDLWMPRITIPASALRSISDSGMIYLKIEEAMDCYGEHCLEPHGPTLDEDGDPTPVGPHYHMVVSGSEPDSGPRYYAVGAGLFT